MKALMITAKKIELDKLPTTSGVYLFKNRKAVLYIGKANNLRSRIRNYFGQDVPIKVRNLLEEATKLEVKLTDSEPEALILEAQLIKKHQPKYNVIFRDDKNYFFVGFTKEKYPRVFLTHQPPPRNQKPVSRSQAPGRRSLATEYIGPFTEGKALKTIIKSLRKAIPFCTCRSAHDKLCFNYHLGLCVGACCLKPKAAARYQYLDTAKTRRGYLQNVHYLKTVLLGKRKKLISELKSKMTRMAKKEYFERAAEIRDLIESLENILAHKNISFRNEFLEQAQLLTQLKRLFKLKNEPNRIEAYDISNIAGILAVGTMVVFNKTESDKNEYRKFKIKTVKGADDIAMMKEVLRRRFNHQEWLKPDLIYIDGGIAQMNIAKEVVAEKDLKIPIVAFAKGLQNVFVSTMHQPVKLNKLPEKVKNFIVKIKDEVHRFSITYHRKLRSKEFIKKK